MLAQTIEISAGLVLAAGLAVVGPLAIIGGVFVAWGKLRSSVDANKEAIAEAKAERATLRESGTALGERLRAELDAHARLLAERGEGRDRAVRAQIDRDRQSVDRRITSLERWQQRVLGAAEASRHTTGVPSRVDGDTAPMSMPITTPRVHQRSGLYPMHHDPDDDDPNQDQ